MVSMPKGGRESENLLSPPSTPSRANVRGLRVPVPRPRLNARDPGHRTLHGTVTCYERDKPLSVPLKAA